MALLAAAAYDPAGAVTKATSSLLAMTALDTTNLRLTFTAPTNGTVLVRLRGATTGATNQPKIQLGVLDGGTVRMRMTPMMARVSALATENVAQEATGLVTGLTPGQSYTWDAAYGVDVVVASTNLKYGGPDDANGADAWGAFVFEVWETTNLLAGTLYDPSSIGTKVLTSLLAMTALDTTNLRLTFTAPASGKVMWRIHTQAGGTATTPFQGSPLLGILEGASVIARQAPLGGVHSLSVTNPVYPLEASGVASVSAGSHTWDAAYGVQVVTAAGGAIKYGGLNDTTTNNAWGGTAFEIWTA